MDLYQKISDDLKEALKNHDELKVSTLRLLLTSFHNKEIEKKSKEKDQKLTEEEIIEILMSEAKKRKEAIEVYLKGNRADLADKENKELNFIQSYLPQQMTETEIRNFVQTKIKELGVNSIKDFGKTMGILMKELKGKADASLVNKILKEELQS
jgi:hypothetical protein